jgi:type I restriction enzyme S subunit
MMLIRAGKMTDAAFLEMVLNSPLITKIALGRTTGGAAPRVNVSTVKAYPIPCPPLTEQKRIVAKVNQLMVMCNELESKLRQAEADSENLMYAAVRDILASNTSSPEYEFLSAFAS